MDAPHNTPINKWYSELILPTLLHQVKLNAVRFTGKTAYQSVEIIETDPMGLTLVLDGKTQSAQMDEFIYHEALVHPALVTHGSNRGVPLSVFIAGGGEGATLREVLAGDAVQCAVMVDLDGDLVDICKQHLPTWHQGAFEDRRAEVHYNDALKHLREHAETYDVIIVDVNDPTAGGPSYLLYTDAFYGLLKSRLNPNGIIVTQAGPTSIGTSPVIAAIASTMKRVFPHAYPYQVDMLSFGCNWGFVMGTLGADPLALTRAEVDRRLAERDVQKLRFYDGMAHQGIFGLPKWLRESIDAETRVITENDPILSVF